MTSMDTLNPYQAPTGLDPGPITGKYCETGIFTNGRIGRLRYLGYSLAVMLLFYMAIALVVAAGAFILPDSSEIVIGSAVVALVIPMIIITVKLGIRRLNDMNATGAYMFLMLVPIVNSIFTLVLMLVSGTPSSNKYGSPPPPNPRSMGAVVAIFFLIPVTGIVAAIALPAYQDYVERAKAVQTTP
ncbi:Inner membrane protein YhaI [BD1-7 clade bacterium]|uniref:Inner membrane protein YhaI n=1 Tax=BD1-7 clade bacterium TaxID=2029982 RepID=A0A5S9MZD2_9GAMM|nr:Inner membrane protein YhaI [BD1-7 clade bacterium]